MAVCFPELWESSLTCLQAGVQRTHRKFPLIYLGNISETLSLMFDIPTQWKLHIVKLTSKWKWKETCTL